jgi:lysophospholipase L1-like esterase
MAINRETATREQPPPRRRRWLSRLIAMGFGLSLLAAFEGLCRLCDWGRPERQDDPFVGFREIRPLFVLSEDGSRYEIPKARQTHFRPQSFAAQKPDSEYRIFCLGGSTVQGRPYAVETSFTTWLELSLQVGDPSRRWRVVNCGGISYSTYRLAPILEEVLRYEPDLIILCEGHNEFLESRSFAHIQDRGELFNASLAAVSRLHTYSLMRGAYARLRGWPTNAAPAGRPILPVEVEALLDYRGGLEEYHRDEAWRANVIGQFRFNLHRMVQLAREANVELILINPPANIGDMPPFKAEHSPGLTPEDLARWEALLESAREHFRGEKRSLRAAIAKLEQACRIDPLHAGGWYTLAECYRTVGRMDDARDAYLKAKELDVCPLRILQPMNEAILDVARETQAPLVDAQRLFEQNSPHGIVGSDQLVDHVHPSFQGHQRIADALAEKLIELGVFRPAPDWQAKKRLAFQRQLDSLDDYYYLEGERRLKNLRLWARGRAKRIRPTSSTSDREPAGDSAKSGGLQ